jgi:hypothetical protein
MYQYSAWITLRDSTYEGDNEKLHAGIAQVSIALRALSSVVPDNPINAVNGEVLLQCSGGHNRPGQLHHQLLALLHTIAEVLPGSHGLVYWCDDEDMRVANNYQVIVLARGKIHNEADPFLSPMNPKIED